MPDIVEYFKWWIRDETTGQRRLTVYKLSRADAQRAFPGAVPDLASREVRLPIPTGETGHARGSENSRVQVFAFEVFSMRSAAYVRAVSKGTREAIGTIAGSKLIEESGEWVSETQLDRGFFLR